MTRRKKKKIDKRDLEENNAFYCDICDKGFKTEEVYTIHTSSHQKCKVEGCPYTAAPKLVQIHYNMQHKTGLAKKIWQFESPEDVAKWRAERKKNFPTAAVVEKKMAERAEKIARGEVLENKFFGKFRNQTVDRGRGRGRGGGRGWGQQNCTQSRNLQVSQSPQKRSHDQRIRPQATGPKKAKTTVSQKEDSGLTQDPLSFILPVTAQGSDEECENQGPLGPAEGGGVAPGEGNPLAAGGLGSLMCSYGSDSGEEEEVGAGSKKTTTTPGKVNEENEVTVDGEEGESSNHRRQRRKRGRKGKQNNQKNVTASAQKSTLLEKLLAPEIRHERNVILQCVRYIVENKFFGLAKDTSAQEISNEGKAFSIIANADEEIWENGL